jgi:phosphinothricin acetyltransferase
LSTPHIRHAEPFDLPAIVAIYNAAIPDHTATADLRPVTVTDRLPWFAAHDPHTSPLWVAEDAEAQIAGWASLSTFYPRAAWAPTAELSLYVHPDRRRAGVGRALLEHTVAAAMNGSIDNIIALVFAHNAISLHLLEVVGFERWGLLPSVCQMPEGRRDVVILGRRTAAA